MIDTATAIAALGAIGTWAQIVIEWRKERSHKMTQNEGGRESVAISRRALIGIVMALAVWTVASVYLMYRVTSIPAAVDPKTIIATFNIGSWGVLANSTQEPTAIFVDVLTTNSGLQAKNYNLVVIGRIADNTVDEMSDTRIDRSPPFSVVLGTRRIEVPISAASLLRLKNGGLVIIYAIALPTRFSPSQIASVAGLQDMGAKIVGMTGVSIPKH
jgi:hypothetical protein